MRAESSHLYCRGLKEAVRAASRVEAGTLSPMPVVQCVGEITSGGEQTKQREGDASMDTRLGVRFTGLKERPEAIQLSSGRTWDRLQQCR